MGLDHCSRGLFPPKQRKIWPKCPKLPILYRFLVTMVTCKFPWQHISQPFHSHKCTTYAPVPAVCVQSTLQLHCMYTPLRSGKSHFQITVCPLTGLALPLGDWIRGIGSSSKIKHAGKRKWSRRQAWTISYNKIPAGELCPRYTSLHIKRVYTSWGTSCP